MIVVRSDDQAWSVSIAGPPEPNVVYRVNPPEAEKGPRGVDGKCAAETIPSLMGARI